MTIIEELSPFFDPVLLCKDYGDVEDLYLPPVKDLSFKNKSALNLYGYFT